MSTKTVKAAELVLDFDLYPRPRIDSLHLAEMCNAEEAGVKFPPVIADRKSKRVIDGFHRIRKQLRLYGEGADVECEFRTYASEAEMFKDAMSLNAHHGRALDPFDKAHCIVLALRLGITEEDIALSLAVTTERIKLIRSTKTASVHNGARLVIPIKRTIRHKAGKTLTKKQALAVDKLGGMEQLFYVNQIILLIENDLLDTDNDDLMRTLKKLKEMIP